MSGIILQIEKKKHHDPNFQEIDGQYSFVELLNRSKYI